MIAGGQLRENCVAGSENPKRVNRESLGTTTAFEYSHKSTSGLFFLNGVPISIGALIQTLTAWSTMKEEPMMTIRFEGDEIAYFSNYKMKIDLKS